MIKVQIGRATEANDLRCSNPQNGQHFWGGEKFQHLVVSSAKKMLLTTKIDVTFGWCEHGHLQILAARTSQCTSDVDGVARPAPRRSVHACWAPLRRIGRSPLASALAWADSLDHLWVPSQAHWRDQCRVHGDQGTMDQPVNHDFDSAAVQRSAPPDPCPRPPMRTPSRRTLRGGGHWNRVDGHTGKNWTKVEGARNDATEARQTARVETRVKSRGETGEKKTGERTGFVSTQENS